jgi:hypothetical protein
VETKIIFEPYEFSVATLTEAGVVTPLSYDIVETEDGLVANSNACVFFDDDRRPYDGEIILSIEKTKTKGIRWQVQVSTADLIKGVKVKVETVPGISIMEAGGNPVEIEDGKGYSTIFPSGWYMTPRIPQSGFMHPGANGSQHLFIEGENNLMMLSSDDYPPRFQRYWFDRKDNELALTVYLESNVSDRQTKLSTPNWTLEPIINYEKGILKHMAWVQDAYGLKPIAQRADAPDWIHDLCFNITFHCHANHGRMNVTFSDIERVLEKAARYFDPANTQLHIVGWDGPWDMTWPAFEPGNQLGGADGFHKLMQIAHRLGYKIGLHMNVMGLSYQHPQFDELKHFLQYQSRDSANRPLNWEHDIDGDDQDEIIFAYISPDAPEWRGYLIERILNFVNKYKSDIVHLDQSTTFINGHNHDHWRGVNTLYQELREKLPEEVALSGEFTNEMVAHLYPLCGYFPLPRTDLQRNVFVPYIRAFNYGYPPEPTRESLLYDAFGRSNWNAEAFYKDLEKAEEAGLMPTLLIGKPNINLDSDEARAVFAAAKRFRDKLYPKEHLNHDNT